MPQGLRRATALLAGDALLTLAFVALSDARFVAAMNARLPRPPASRPRRLAPARVRSFWRCRSPAWLADRPRSLRPQRGGSVAEDCRPSEAAERMLQSRSSRRANSFRRRSGWGTRQARTRRSAGAQQVRPAAAGRSRSVTTSRTPTPCGCRHLTGHQAARRLPDRDGSAGAGGPEDRA